MAVKLGFQVRPGGDFGDGVANRVIPFADNSYLELLYFTLPEAQLKGEPRDFYAATERGSMANMFAMETAMSKTSSTNFGRRAGNSRRARR